MVEAETAQRFGAAMRAAGLEPPENIQPGKLHRFSTNGKRNDDAGWCLLFPDLLGGAFGDHRTGLSETWQAKRDKPLTATQREVFRHGCEQAKQERQAEQATKHAKAARKAQAL